MDSGPTPQRRHLVAVWFADIVGFSALASRNEDDAVRLVEAFQACVTAEVSRHGGRIVKYIGDAALAEFHSTEQAAHAACALVEAFAAATGGRLRVGLHVGEVTVAEDEDLLGDGVNLAARLQAEAQPGEVIASEDAWRQLRRREAFRFEELGRRKVRGQAHPVRMFRVCTVEEVGSAGEDIRGAGTGLLARAAEQPAVRRLREKLALSPSRVASIAILIALGAYLVLSVGVGWDRITQLSPIAGSSAVTAAEGAASRPRFDPAHIAVLYFEDNSPDAQLGYLAKDLTEALIVELNQVPAISVTSSNGVKPFRDGSASLDSIARALAVGSIVQGSVTRSVDRARVTVQLVDPVSGTALQSSVVEQPFGDPLALQDSVVSMVATVLRRRLGRVIELRTVEHSTDNREAYELYMRGNMAWEEYAAVRNIDLDAAKRALIRGDSILAEAEALDPGWLEPIVRMGWYRRELSLISAEVSGQLDTIWSKDALALAERAVALGGAPAFELRGTLRLELAKKAQGPERDRLLGLAEADLRHATSLDPDRAVAWVKLSGVLLEQTRYAEAVYAARRSIEADGFLEEAEHTLHSIYFATLQLGPEDEAVRLCEEGRRRFPTSDEFVLCRFFVLASFPQVPPDLRHARALIDTLKSVLPPYLHRDHVAYGTMLAAQVAARAGMRDSAEALIREAHRLSPELHLELNEAHARLSLGDEEGAIQLASRWLEVEPDTAYLATEWWFAPLRRNPRFLALLGRHAVLDAGTITPE